jgi:tetratricopeptide (TPR) repeat protein
MSADIQLDGKLFKAIEAHCAQGDLHTEVDAFELALAEYEKAWALLPDPQRAWEVATWIKIAIADVYFFSGRLTEAETALDFALTCPGGLANPYLELRMGQVLFERGETGEARECLANVLAAVGEEIFEGEDEKYLSLARQMPG